VPVRAGEAERREGRIALAELLHQLLAGGEELRLALRRARAAGGLVLVLPVDHGPRARVIRDAVQLAVVRTGALEALKPRPRVGEVRGLQLLERAVGHVLRRLRVAELEDVRGVAARDRGV